jgi:pimeloyl-ACP methyl ester carboxylesterase/DNA-binding NarL/FixJ family response regulator
VRPVETRYARSGETRIAYQVVGQGPLDLVLVPGFLSNLDILWEDPGYGRFVKRLSAFGRLILFDKRGTGLSDRVAEHASDLAARADDIRAVIDAAGCGRTALIAASEGAAMSILFAAARPERLRALVLCGGYAHFHESVMDAKKFRGFTDGIQAAWGTGATLALLAPGRTDDRRFAEWWARLERLSASPSDALALAKMNAAIDVSAMLADVSAPTLVIHRAEDAYAGIAGGRRLAREIRDARLVELPGRDHLIWMGDVEGMADIVEEFVTGERPIAHSNRVLAVLLVARLVAGFQRAAVEGRFLDERAERFREAVPRVIERYGGYADPFNDRITARFDGPARALHAALALRETADSLGFSIAQGIHVGEIDIFSKPLSGSSLEIADRIAAAARAPDILLSRLASELVSGSGLQFADRGTLVVKGVRDPLPLVALAPERHLEPVLRKRGPADLDTLSAREREVLALVADGLSNSHIAVQLGLSEHTIKRHVANILLKLDLPTRTAAAAVVARQPVR